MLSDWDFEACVDMCCSDIGEYGLMLVFVYLLYSGWN